MVTILLKSLFSRRTLKIVPYLLLLVLILTLYMFYKENRELKKQTESYESYHQQNENAISFQDKDGTWHSSMEPAVIESDKVLKVLSKSDSNMLLLKSEVRGLKKDLKNLSSASVLGNTTTIITEGNLRDSFAILHDTLKVLYQKFDKVTPWMEKHIEIVNGRFTERQTIYDTIMVAAYIKKKWFLGKGHLKVEAFSRNPDSKVVIKEAIIVRK